MDMYSMYLYEREGVETYQTDKGFATYEISGNSCYIRDIYVRPEHRKSSEASIMADEISKLAKSRGCLKLLGSVAPSAKNSTDSLKVLLAYGFKLDSSANNFIVLSKDL